MKTRANADSTGPTSGSSEGTTSGGADEGWAVMTTLLGGFVVWGGIGWLLDRWLETRFLTPVGLIVGMALGIYAVVARYGRPPASPAMNPSARTDLLTAREDRSDPRSGPPPASTRREIE